MPDNNEFTTEKIIEKLIQYLGEHGCVCEDGYRDGIKFSTVPGSSSLQKSLPLMKQYVWYFCTKII